MIAEVGCQMGERQHCYAHCSSYLSMIGLRNCVDYVFYFVGIVGGEGGNGHLFSIVLLVGVGSNSSGGKVSTCWELHVVLQKEVRLLVGLLGEGGS